MFRAGDDTTLPPIEISPPVGCSRPATQRNVVVLPQPDGPSSTTISTADCKLLAQVSDFERRRHAPVRFIREWLTGGNRKSCPTPQPNRHAASRTDPYSDTRPSPPWGRTLPEKQAAPSA